ncbi:MAG: alkaline phosphatase [Thermus sp.]|uniref:alkaline phosphatase n=1 Tax=Thermus sp. TaxID=275 RepID=UPI0025F7EC0A|nr:alkaline phosphatase [Thermus sp.]MCS6868613.1 alkaline phosphatase [Thermus sp.]MCS7219013.1 alkaline phosphatase [Thermus sp.]MCX7848879.1 alkaline phosphatase [Thermus sp.]MDW8017377.1 alkaline phosphatase [Thermus sp.]MDW8356823.1 alkaline phosphatase [Thermus sp.]
MKRRDILKGGLAAGALALLPKGGAQGAPQNQPSLGRRYRNLIVFVYDGFSWEDYAIAQAYARRRLGRVLALERLLARYPNGLMNTFSLTSYVTESSAAGNAFSCGVKTVNGGLAIHADGTRLKPFFAAAKEVGKAVGLVTTTTITHATPASFVVSNPDRNAEAQIAEQYLAFGAEVYLGGGDRFFNPEKRQDKKDMYAEFAKAGYGVAKTPEELARATASKLLGIFSDSHVPYEVDRRFQGVRVPSLKEMVQAALPRLASYRNGFVLQVEAGRIDHSNHLNDPAATLWDVLAADEALEVLTAFVDRNPDTLLILTSDHATGVGALYGAGRSYLESSAGIDLLEAQKASFEHMRRVLGANPDANQVKEAYRAMKGATLSDEEAQMVVEAITKRVYRPDGVRYGIQPDNTMSWALLQKNANKPERPNIGWSSGQHTASPVMLALYGQGLRFLNLGLVDNTHVFRLMGEALGIRYQNPVMSEEEALEILKARPQGMRHPEDVWA